MTAAHRRRAVLKLARGTAQVAVDRNRGFVDVVHVPPLNLAVTPAATAFGVLALVVGVVTLAFLHGTAWAYGIGVLTLVVTVPAWVVLANRFERAPSLRFDVRRGVIELDEVPQPLWDTRVVLSGTDWSFVREASRFPISRAWGVIGASWLQRTLAAVQAGRLDDVELTELLRAPRPRLVTRPRSVEFREDQAGLTAILEPMQSISWFNEFRHLGLAGLLMVWLGFDLEIALTCSLVFVAWAMEGPLNHLLQRRDARYWHVRVHLGPRALDVDEGGETRRVALADIVRTHLDATVIQLDLRDGTATTVGHGWESGALRRLREEIDCVRTSADVGEAAELPPVPEVLDRLRRACGSQPPTS